MLYPVKIYRGGKLHSTIEREEIKKRFWAGATGNVKSGNTIANHHPKAAVKCKYPECEHLIGEGRLNYGAIYCSGQCQRKHKRDIAKKEREDNRQPVRCKKCKRKFFKTTPAQRYCGHPCLSRPAKS